MVINPMFSISAAADLNNDNQMDIVISDVGYNSLGVFLGNGDGTFAAIKTYNTGAGSTAILDSSWRCQQ